MPTLDDLFKKTELNTTSTIFQTQIPQNNLFNKANSNVVSLLYQKPIQQTIVPNLNPALNLSKATRAFFSGLKNLLNIPIQFAPRFFGQPTAPPAELQQGITPYAPQTIGALSAGATRTAENALEAQQPLLNSMLRFLGVAQGGQPMPQRMAWYGQAQRQIQENANQLKAQLIASGINPAQAEMIAQSQAQSAELSLLPQAEQMAKENLLTALGAQQQYAQQAQQWAAQQQQFQLAQQGMLRDWITAQQQLAQQWYAPQIQQEKEAYQMAANRYLQQMQMYLDALRSQQELAMQQRQQALALGNLLSGAAQSSQTMQQNWYTTLMQLMSSSGLSAQELAMRQQQLKAEQDAQRAQQIGQVISLILSGSK